MTQIKTLFIDIGGVLLTNGWDSKMRQKAAEVFELDHKEMESRHDLIFNLYETGRFTLDQYLNWVIFYEARSFSRDNFREFMFSQSQPYQEMIEWMRDIKQRYHLKVVAVSNEGRELTLYRIERFKLNEWIDFFVASSFIGVRKPDRAIYQLAIDASHTQPNQGIYIDDRVLLAEVARSLGLHAIHHKNLNSTRQAFATFGLA